MTREDAKLRLLGIERCTPIHTKDDVRDFVALEMAIEALSAIEDIRAEIELAKWCDKTTKLVKNANASGLEVALDIIDKHISGKDSE